MTDPPTLPPPVAPRPAFSRAAERPAEEPDVFTFELWSPRATFAAHIALFRFPAEGVAWYATAVLREGELVVALADSFPLKSTLELRGNGLWADHNVEDPFVHWSVGLEAFALALEDPADDRGLRVPLGYDLDWEMDATVIGAVPGGYEQPARVRGEVLLGADAYELDARGWRGHRTLAGWSAAAGRSRHGLEGAGDEPAPRWSAPAVDARPGDGALGSSLAVLPAGRLRTALWRRAAPDGAAGFVEEWLPTG